VPAWEKRRKDVYRLRPSGSVTLTMQFGIEFVRFKSFQAVKELAQFYRSPLRPSDGDSACVVPLDVAAKLTTNTYTWMTLPDGIFLAEQAELTQEST
jgi:hypothetical protein